MRSSLKSLLPLLILVCLSRVATSAQQLSFPRYVGHVNDFANVIDEQTEQQLETIQLRMEELSQQISALVGANHSAQ